MEQQNGDVGGIRSATGADRQFASVSTRWQVLSIRRRRRLGFAAVFAVAGIIAVVASWIGATGTRVLSDQLSYIASGGIAGLGLLGIAGAILLSDYMVENESRLDRLQEMVEELLVGGTGVPSTISGGGSGRRASASTGGFVVPSSQALVIVEGGRRFHRADCSLVTGKSKATEIDSAFVAEQGFEPCRVCNPSTAGVPVP